MFSQYNQKRKPKKITDKIKELTIEFAERHSIYNDLYLGPEEARTVTDEEAKRRIEASTIAIQNLRTIRAMKYLLTEKLSAIKMSENPENEYLSDDSEDLEVQAYTRVGPQD